MKNIVLGFLFALFANAVIGQTVLSGNITNSQNKAIEGVVVESNDGLQTKTNVDGFYKIKSKSGIEKVIFSHPLYQTETKKLSSEETMKLDLVMIELTNVMDEVLVSAIRENESSPMTYSELNKEELGERNLGQDLPILLNYLPSVVTTTDAGAGVGYTGLRVRGSDATRVNITINGVPYNDSESQGTFWVNLPDFSSSVENVQLTRGVGSSTNGTGAFGANLSLMTEGIENEASAEIANSVGSFNTRKHTLKFNSGLLNDHFLINGRISKINSDGYIERASSDLSSYFFQVGFKNKKTTIKAITFGGFEETYQAWYGIDPATLEENRRANFAGYYTDENGDVKYYDQEVDHYNQDHYQLLIDRKLSSKLNLNITGHYTYGRGYFEQYKEDESLADYNLTNIINGNDTIAITDLIRRRWLDNNFYGAIASLTYQVMEFNSTLGVSWNQYLGDHFGEIIWAQFASNSEIRDRYYDNYGNKDELNLFWKNNYNLNENIQLFGDIQLRSVQYEATGVTAEKVSKDFSFFNPKAGLSYKTNKGLYYLSYARANKEPSRTDFENGNPEPEELDDFELGWRGEISGVKLNLNGYYMLYKNQLVLTGLIDDVGNPVKTNIGESFRTGIEFDAKYLVEDKFVFSPNFSLSINENIGYINEGANGLENLGNTKIAFSPNFVFANKIGYSPTKNLWVNILSKYVGEQFMGNIEAPLSMLDAYFVNDLSLNYSIKPKSAFKKIQISLLVNNIFDQEYISNGYWGPGYVGYYPQAGINFLAGLNLKF